MRWKGEKAAAFRRAPPPHLWAATYHQKFALIDEAVTVIGGIDVDDRRWDTRRHAKRADQTWHDISCRVEGPASADVAAHFRRLWNRELPRYHAIVAEWTDGAGRRLMLGPLTEVPAPAAAPAPAAGPASVQVLRTQSRRSRASFARGPEPHIPELKAAHRAMILSARRTLYIEAQFFRSDEAAQWVLTALARNADLEIIILVANTPEEIAFEGQGANPAHKHGEWLQAKALGALIEAGGERLGLFTLVKHEAVRASEDRFAESRGTAFGSGLIHIHAKLLIADDASVLISSANINGRSFDWDTELGILWRQDGDAIRRFRLDLWSQLFGGPVDPALDLAAWRATAEANATAAPEARRGFVLPYQLGRARRYARPFWFVPDDLV